MIAINYFDLLIIRMWKIKIKIKMDLPVPVLFGSTSHSGGHTLTLTWRIDDRVEHNTILSASGVADIDMCRWKDELYCF